MKLVRIVFPAFAVSLALTSFACSGGSGGTFSIVDGVYDDTPVRGDVPPVHGYEQPNGKGGSEGSSDAGRSRDSGVAPTQDAGGNGRPFACGTPMQCTAGATKADVVYDCNSFRSDGKVVSGGNEVGTWAQSGSSSISFVLKGGDGGSSTTFTCIPKPAGPVDAGKDAAKDAEPN
ncbi:MAG: hypothetical protein U0174_07645 [Polyangiaceae bacterium]